MLKKLRVLIEVVVLLFALPSIVFSQWNISTGQAIYEPMPETELTIEIQLDGEGDDIDAFGLDLNFPVDLLEFQGAEFTGSLIETWPFKDTNQYTAGTIRIAAFSATDLVSAPATGLLVKLNFTVKAVEEGEGELIFSDFFDDLFGATSTPAVIRILTARAWQLPLTITDGDISLIKNFGGDKAATDGFDLGLDLPAPPPGMNYYAYFMSTDFPHFLSTDLRTWDLPFTNDIFWNLKLVNADDRVSTISWDPAELPSIGNFTMICSQGAVDMRLNSSFEVAGNIEITIVYSLLPLMTTWNVPLTLTNENSSHTRIIGGAPQAGAAFDSDFDRAIPPPGMTFYSYFRLSQFPNYLANDFRQWLPPWESQIVWSLSIVNTFGSATTIQWDSALLPPQGFFSLFDAGAGAINMRESSEITLTGDRTLQIIYSLNKIPNEWKVPLLISGDGLSLTREFGGAPAATSAFDSGLDIPTAPPGMTWYACFTMSEFPNFLATDLQHWSAPFSSEITWTLNVTNAENITSEITWDASLLPGTGQFSLAGGTAQPVDMRAQNSVSVEGNRALTIQYQPVAGSSSPLDKNGFSTVRMAENTVKAFSLQQNYPNPFNPETTISFQIAEDSFVKITVFDVTGRRISTLLMKEMPAGRHEVKWNGKDEAGFRAASGIYFYRLQTAQYQADKKMILMQ